jgi:hypothetical protein
MKTKNWLLLLFILTAFIFNGCDKEKDLPSKMTVKMTDAPATFLAVNVDIREFQVHYANSTNDEAWVSLPVNGGIYDLLTLQNDITTTLVSDADIKAGYITQVRLVLGNQNTVVTLDGEFPMNIPSGLQTGIKINLDTDVRANTTIEVLLDFDASASVVLEGNGTYSLKPVIKVESVTQM